MGYVNAEPKILPRFSRDDYMRLEQKAEMKNGAQCAPLRI